MKTFRTNKQLCKTITTDKRDGKKIAFVPTMGNLHEGHIELVRQAKRIADKVVVSIFVNPLQFGSGEDIECYPRTLSTDTQKLFTEGCDYLLCPDVKEIYPDGLSNQTLVMVPDLSDALCGACRPGHFAGVATVVNKLFQIVQPDVAIFGKKDYQQLAIIEKMVKDLCMPINILGVNTVRDIDGLALSSRNCFLTKAERNIAPLLHKTLQDCREAIACGFDNYSDLELRAMIGLKQAGFKPDYVSVRDAATLKAANKKTEQIVILAAAQLGKPRLIDNVTLTINPAQDWGMLATH